MNDDDPDPARPGAHWKACHCCGLVQVVPALAERQAAYCTRCRTRIWRPGRHLASSRIALALALSALVLYPLAILLPIMTFERFGHRNEASIWSGTLSLLEHGQLFVGGVVFVCSVVLPLLKLGALVSITLGSAYFSHRHRASTYRWIEWTGRWGMLDVLLLALLVAFVKVGDLVEVTPGPAALTFTLVVGLSLAASASFDPHALWEDESA